VFLIDKTAFSKRLNKVDMLNSRDLGRYINQVLLMSFVLSFDSNICKNFTSLQLCVRTM